MTPPPPRLVVALGCSTQKTRWRWTTRHRFHIEGRSWCCWCCCYCRLAHSLSAISSYSIRRLLDMRTFNGSPSLQLPALQTLLLAPNTKPSGRCCAHRQPNSSGLQPVTQRYPIQTPHTRVHDSLSTTKTLQAQPQTPTQAVSCWLCCCCCCWLPRP